MSSLRMCRSMMSEMMTQVTVCAAWVEKALPLGS